MVGTSDVLVNVFGYDFEFINDPSFTIFYFLSDSFHLLLDFSKLFIYLSELTVYLSELTIYLVEASLGRLGEFIYVIHKPQYTVRLIC